MTGSAGAWRAGWRAASPRRRRSQRVVSALSTHARTSSTREPARFATDPARPDLASGLRQRQFMESARRRNRAAHRCAMPAGLPCKQQTANLRRELSVRRRRRATSSVVCPSVSALVPFINRRRRQFITSRSIPLEAALRTFITAPRLPRHAVSLVGYQGLAIILRVQGGSS